MLSSHNWLRLISPDFNLRNLFTLNWAVCGTLCLTSRSSRWSMTLGFLSRRVLGCALTSLSWVAYPIDSYPLASLAGILNLGLALAIASGVITASVRPKAGQAPVFEGKPTFRTTPTPKMYTASYESVEQQTKSAFARDATKDIVIASAVFVSIRRLGRVRPR